MDTALSIAQALLAAIFLITGTVKLTQPREKMAAGPMRWAADVTDGQFRTLGALEVLAAVGAHRCRGARRHRSSPRSRRPGSRSR